MERPLTPSSATSNHHIPVMLKEVIQTLNPKPGLYVDATFGRGSYTRAILDTPHTQVIAIDRDEEAIAFGQHSFQEDLASGRLILHHKRFSDLSDVTEKESLNGIVFDFGLSSPQLASLSRGFSFQTDAPLDMRMGLDQLQAKDLLNKAREETIADALYTYGGERRSRFLAKKIIKQRAKKSFETTKDLLALFPEHKPRYDKKQKIHPATRTFQALRIWTNNELKEIESVLPQTTVALKSGGHFVAVSFHSLEDRLIKRHLKPSAPDFLRHEPFDSINSIQPAPVFRCPAPQPLRPSPCEIKQNPRSRSAKLRWGMKIGSA